MHHETFDKFLPMATLPKIALLTPTRDRPGKLMQCLNGFVATTASPATRIYVGVDDDDPQRDAILDIVGLFKAAVAVPIAAQPRFPGLGWLWNKVAEKAMADGCGIYGMMGDDTVIKTRGWDLAVANAYASAPADGLLCAYVDEGNDPRKKTTSVPFVSREYIELVGRYVPEDYPVDGIDAHLAAVHKAVGRLKLVRGVLFQHLHWRKGHSEPDSTTLVRMDWLNNKKETLNRWPQLEQARVDEAAKMRSYIQTTHTTGAVS